MSMACVQDIYRCDTCMAAKDEFGRGCKYGDLFPLLLLMSGNSECENYEFDAIKAELHLQRKENVKSGCNRVSVSPESDNIQS